MLAAGGHLQPPGDDVVCEDTGPLRPGQLHTVQRHQPPATCPCRVPRYHVSPVFIVLSSTFTFQVRRQSCQLIITQTQFINFILQKKLKLNINNII